MADASLPEQITHKEVNPTDRMKVENRSIPSGLEPYATTPFSTLIFRTQMQDTGLASEQELAQAAVVPENLLGRGGNGRVYRIPGIDSYVLKVPGVHESNVVTIGELDELEDPFPNLNVGQSVATMGKALLLKAQSGLAAGGATGKDRYTLENIASYEQRLRIAADMPPSAYDLYASLLEYLHKNGYESDPSKSSNILMDTERRVLNVVDVLRATDTSRYNTLAYMAVPLVDNAYARKLSAADPEAFARTQETRRIILAKVLDIGREKGLPLPDEEYSGFHYTLELAGMSDESIRIKEETTKQERDDAAQLADVRGAIQAAPDETATAGEAGDIW